MGYSDGESVQAGQEVRLECVSRGGNPLASIVWFKNGAKVDHTFETSGRESRNVLAFRAEPSDNNARFRCEVTSKLTAPLRAEVTLIVRCKSRVLFTPPSPGEILKKPGAPSILSIATGVGRNEISPSLSRLHCFPGAMCRA